MTLITMVHKKLPESVIVSAIQAGPGQFNTSTNELIRLNAAGVTEKELNAMLNSGNGAASAKAGTAQAPDAMPASKLRTPRLTVTQGNSTQELKLEKTNSPDQDQTFFHEGSGGRCSGEPTMQAGVNTAVSSAATHMNSGMGGSAVQQAGSIFSGVMSHRTPTVTYVWGVPSPASTNILQSSKPAFTIDFSRTIGINPDDYEPAIVNLHRRRTLAVSSVRPKGKKMYVPLLPLIGKCTRVSSRSVLPALPRNSPPENTSSLRTLS